MKRIGYKYLVVGVCEVNIRLIYSTSCFAIRTVRVKKYVFIIDSFEKQFQREFD